MVEEGKMITLLSDGLTIHLKFYLNRLKIASLIGIVATQKMENIVCGVFIIEMEITVPQEDSLIHINQV